MGYLTTLTIYNDGIDLITKHPQKFAEEVLNASGSLEAREFGLGYFCNLVNVQKTRHADDHTLYVHMGNCVTEVNPYSKEFKELAKQCPTFARQLVLFVKDNAKELERALSEITKEGEQ